MTAEQLADAILFRTDHTPHMRAVMIDVIKAAFAVEHERITVLAEQIETGVYTTTKTVSQVLKAERIE